MPLASPAALAAASVTVLALADVLAAERSGARPWLWICKPIAITRPEAVLHV
jgi:hypothetical protein